MFFTLVMKSNTSLSNAAVEFDILNMMDLALGYFVLMAYSKTCCIPVFSKADVS